jgi:hypothetical protein
VFGGRKIQDFQRDPMGIPTKSPAMRMGKKRLMEKAYTNGKLGQVERGRERERMRMVTSECVSLVEING